MTTTAFGDQFTAAPEHVTHQPYGVTAILRQNVADLGRELQRQRERADRAETELKAAREQKPVAWADGDGGFYALLTFLRPIITKNSSLSKSPAENAQNAF